MRENSHFLSGPPMFGPAQKKTTKKSRAAFDKDWCLCSQDSHHVCFMAQASRSYTYSGHFRPSLSPPSIQPLGPIHRAIVLRSVTRGTMSHRDYTVALFLHGLLVRSEFICGSPHLENRKREMRSTSTIATSDLSRDCFLPDQGFVFCPLLRFADYIPLQYFPCCRPAKTLSNL